MKLQEIKDEILVKNNELGELTSKMIQIQHALSELRNKEKEAESEAFIDYISVGDTFTITNNIHMNVSATGKTLKEGNRGSIFFKPGDEFSIIRKNKKSISIKVTKKTETKFKDVVVPGSCGMTISKQRYTETTNPEWTFRINLDILRYNMMRDPSFKDQMITSYKRKEALQLILG